ncbi:hypothetical protein GCM10010840_34180 [Deinococcus aerolatus]|uniref:Uncharacterized protein n=1 Tax=Deinococcus aerolatus TaxID=522487 RepID=A0ABQ2GF51_9DEIO|nr:hypothetical protein [Deinococcus aerolatus]GGL93313.1 hypothetical protein GCM10010840_34180 [Deinococcus aerolatus]
MTGDHETRILPAWLYPLCFWLALPTLLVSVLVPGWQAVGVWFMMAVPAFAALVVAVTQWRHDRRVSVAAFTALAGLALVIGVRQLIG